MGLKINIIIAKGCKYETLSQFVFGLGFKIKNHLGQFDLLSVSNPEKNQVAIGQINGLIYITHSDLPTFLIEEELPVTDYRETRKYINQSSERYVAAILQSSVNLFGYGINISGFSERALVGSFEGMLIKEGSLQEEEKFLKANLNKETNKVLFDDKEYELHDIGDKLTVDVLNNFCGGEFMNNDLKMNLFEVSNLKNRRLIQSVEGYIRHFGYSDEEIVNYTGLDIEDVREIRAQMIT
ncbi:MAG: hypothetical protein IT258_13080 [Saprospiraceae bacterium]|nr:hypothetical protein [Saprospiraceae bacterium]